MIYHNGVHFTAPVRGKKRFLMERAFLDDLVAPKFGRYRSNRPVPDPTTEFYDLTNEEVEAYSTYRHRLNKMEWV
jgi:hypothetical protein